MQLDQPKTQNQGGGNYEHMSGFLLVNLEKSGLDWMFDTFWYGMEHSGEAGPEM